MSILKSDKPTIEEVAVRLERLEKRVGFILIPAVTTLLDEKGLPDEARQYLIDLLQKHVVCS